MVGGEGYTAPERVSPRGADNATNPVLVCLPCILLVNRQDGAPYQKSSSLACAQLVPKILKTAPLDTVRLERPVNCKHAVSTKYCETPLDLFVQSIFDVVCGMNSPLLGGLEKKDCALIDILDAVSYN